MRRVLLRLLMVIAALAAGVLVFNASWLAPAPDDPRVRLISHRGVHQTFDRAGLDNDTCTAARIEPPRHGYLENTLPSMQAAFEAGADVVEIDVHPTTDGRFAVFHDWTVDCRTEGTGETRSHDMATLKSLDIGYGYTADGGATFPFRGTGQGLMPSLSEVFEAFPEGRFLVNFKSRDASEADRLALMLEEQPAWREQLWGVYGGDEPTERAKDLVAGLDGFGSRSTRDCLLQYVLLGWSGHVPAPCRGTYVMVPGNLAWVLWGWPHRFAERMRSAGSSIILLGPLGPGDPGTAGIDTLDQLALIPEGFDGYVWTNRIEDIGPALRRGASADAPAPDPNGP